MVVVDKWLLRVPDAMAIPPPGEIFQDRGVFPSHIEERTIAHDELTAIKVCFQDTDVPRAHGRIEHHLKERISNVRVCCRVDLALGRG